MIIKGWLKQRGECPENLNIFWNYHDELSILDGLILKGTHTVIPNQCRDEILDQLHEGHFRVDCTKLRAHDSVYWTNITNILKIWSKCAIYVNKTEGEMTKSQQFHEKNH